MSSLRDLIFASLDVVYCLFSLVFACFRLSSLVFACLRLSSLVFACPRLFSFAFPRFRWCSRVVACLSVVDQLLIRCSVVFRSFSVVFFSCSFARSFVRSFVRCERDDERLGGSMRWRACCMPSQSFFRCVPSVFSGFHSFSVVGSATFQLFFPHSLRVFLKNVKCCFGFLFEK